MRFRILKLVLFTVGCGVTVPLCEAPARAQQAGERAILPFCDWTLLDNDLLQDLSDGQLDQQSLLVAALIAGGNHPQVATDLAATFTASARRFRDGYPSRPAVDRTLVQQLFLHVQQNYLHGTYHPNLCDVGQSISHGTFNCLTATLLFRSLCREFAIETVAIWEPAHVRCWVPIGDGHEGYLVETTAKSMELAVSNQMSRHLVAERGLTKEQLLGKVFYNRGVQLLKREAFSHALSATWTGCCLDLSDHSAQNNLRACLNNWALSVFQHRGDFTFATQLLDAGLQLDPDYEPFSRNLRLLRDH